MTVVCFACFACVRVRGLMSMSLSRGRLLKKSSEGIVSGQKGYEFSPRHRRKTWLKSQQFLTFFDLNVRTYVRFPPAPFVAFSPSFPSSFPPWFGYGVPDSKTASSALVVVSGGGGGSGFVSVVSVFFALVCSCFLIFTRFCSVLFRR